MTTSTISPPSMKAWLIDWLATELGVASSTIDPSQTFLNFGLNSVQAMTMVGDLETKLAVRLSPTLAWDYPDINSLSAYLDERVEHASPIASNSATVAGGTQPLAPAGDAASLLAEIDSLSDEEVESLLAQYQGEAK